MGKSISTDKNFVLCTLMSLLISLGINAGLPWFPLVAGSGHPHRLGQGPGRLSRHGQGGRLPLLQHSAAHPGHAVHDAGRVLLLRHGQQLPPLRPGLAHLHTLHVAHQEVGVMHTRGMKSHIHKYLQVM